MNRLAFRISTCASFVVAFTLGAPLRADKADKVSTPFNGKDLTGWKVKDPKKSQWVVGAATLAKDNQAALAVAASGTELVNAKGGGADVFTDYKVGNATIEVEVMVPRGSNSGIYVMGEYEVQVFDSHGRKQLGQGDMGAIYSAAAPKLNASKPPGEWQKYTIEFRAPKFDAVGKKTANARFVKVTLNDAVIHENVEVKTATPGGLTGKEAATGPLMFQGDHGAVAYRNIKITPTGDQ